VRHLLPVPVAERLGERAARADPAAVRSLAEEVHETGMIDEGLNSADHEPPHHRLFGEEVPDEQRPREHEPKGAPVLAPVRVGDRREEVVGDGLAEAASSKAPLCPMYGQDDVREQKQRDRLNQSQDRRL
jgi:hypothetical protein